MKKIFTKSAFVFLCLFSLPLINHAQSHLLLSELTLTPTAGEYIEFYNPTTVSVSLDNYYLADNAWYAYLPSGNFTLGNADFLVRFPAGSEILPGEVMVVAMLGTDFNTTYGVTADFEVGSQDPGVADMVVIQVSGTPTLTNAGEGVILFYWDGASDLVQDVDMMNAGVPTAANMLTPKTGISVDGPDADTISSTYLPDAGTIPLQAATPGFGFSTKRILPETGYEITSGGNGITGNDETSEDISITWDAAFTAPDPGFSSLVTAVENLLPPYDAMAIYPNPATDHFTIAVSPLHSGFQMRITDLSGRVVYDALAPTHKLEVNTAAFEAGVYFVQMQTAEITKTKKLLIAR